MIVGTVRETKTEEHRVGIAIDVDLFHFLHVARLFAFAPEAVAAAAEIDFDHLRGGWLFDGDRRAGDLRGDPGPQVPFRLELARQLPQRPLEAAGAGQLVAAHAAADQSG